MKVPFEFNPYEVRGTPEINDEAFFQQNKIEADIYKAQEKRKDVLNEVRKIADLSKVFNILSKNSLIEIEKDDKVYSNPKIKVNSLENGLYEIKFLDNNGNVIGSVKGDYNSLLVMPRYSLAQSDTEKEKAKNLFINLVDKNKIQKDIVISLYRPELNRINLFAGIYNEPESKINVDTKDENYKQDVERYLQFTQTRDFFKNAYSYSGQDFLNFIEKNFGVNDRLAIENISKITGNLPQYVFEKIGQGDEQYLKLYEQSLRGQKSNLLEQLGRSLAQGLGDLGQSIYYEIAKHSGQNPIQSDLKQKEIAKQTQDLQQQYVAFLNAALNNEKNKNITKYANQLAYTLGQNIPFIPSYVIGSNLAGALGTAVPFAGFYKTAQNLGEIQARQENLPLSDVKKYGVITGVSETGTELPVIEFLMNYTNINPLLKGVISSLGEGIGEAINSAIENYTLNKMKKINWSSQDTQDVIDSFIVGTLLGGLFETPVGIIAAKQKLQNKLQANGLQTQEAEELSNNIVNTASPIINKIQEGIKQTQGEEKQELLKAVNYGAEKEKKIENLNVPFNTKNININVPVGQTLENTGIQLENQTKIETENELNNKLNNINKNINNNVNNIEETKQTGYNVINELEKVRGDIIEQNKNNKNFEFKLSKVNDNVYGYYYNKDNVSYILFFKNYDINKLNNISKDSYLQNIYNIYRDENTILNNQDGIIELKADDVKIDGDKIYVKNRLINEEISFDINEDIKFFIDKLIGNLSDKLVSNKLYYNMQVLKAKNGIERDKIGEYYRKDILTIDDGNSKFIITKNTSLKEDEYKNLIKKTKDLKVELLKNNKKELLKKKESSNNKERIKDYFIPKVFQNFFNEAFNKTITQLDKFISKNHKKDVINFNRIIKSFIKNFQEYYGVDYKNNPLLSEYKIHIDKFLNINSDIILEIQTEFFSKKLHNVINRYKDKNVIIRAFQNFNASLLMIDEIREFVKSGETTLDLEDFKEKIDYKYDDFIKDLQELKTIYDKERGIFITLDEYLKNLNEIEEDNINGRRLLLSIYDIIKIYNLPEINEDFYNYYQKHLKDKLFVFQFGNLFYPVYTESKLNTLKKLFNILKEQAETTELDFKEYLNLMFYDFKNRKSNIIFDNKAKGLENKQVNLMIEDIYNALKEYKEEAIKKYKKEFLNKENEDEDVFTHFENLYLFHYPRLIDSELIDFYNKIINSKDILETEKLINKLEVRIKTKIGLEKNNFSTNILDILTFSIYQLVNEINRNIIMKDIVKHSVDNIAKNKVEIVNKENIYIQQFLDAVKRYYSKNIENKKTALKDIENLLKTNSLRIEHLFLKVGDNIYGLIKSRHNLLRNYNYDDIVDEDIKLLNKFLNNIGVDSYYYYVPIDIIGFFNEYTKDMINIVESRVKYNGVFGKISSFVKTFLLLGGNILDIVKAAANGLGFSLMQSLGDFGSIIPLYFDKNTIKSFFRDYFKFFKDTLKLQIGLSVSEDFEKTHKELRDLGLSDVVVISKELYSPSLSRVKQLKTKFILEFIKFLDKQENITTEEALLEVHSNLPVAFNSFRNKVIEYFKEFILKGQLLNEIKDFYSTFLMLAPAHDYAFRMSFYKNTKDKIINGKFYGVSDKKLIDNLIKNQQTNQAINIVISDFFGKYTATPVFIKKIDNIFLVPFANFMYYSTKRGILATKQLPFLTYEYIRKLYDRLINRNTNNSNLSFDSYSLVMLNSAVGLLMLEMLSYFLNKDRERERKKEIILTKARYGIIEFETPYFNIEYQPFIGTMLVLSEPLLYSISEDDKVRALGKSYFIRLSSMLFPINLGLRLNGYGINYDYQIQKYIDNSLGQFGVLTDYFNDEVYGLKYVSDWKPNLRYLFNTAFRVIRLKEKEIGRIMKEVYFYSKLNDEYDKNEGIQSIILTPEERKLRNLILYYDEKDGEYINQLFEKLLDDLFKKEIYKNLTQDKSKEFSKNLIKILKKLDFNLSPEEYVFQLNKLTEDENLRYILKGYYNEKRIMEYNILARNLYSLSPIRSISYFISIRNNLTRNLTLQELFILRENTKDFDSFIEQIKSRVRIDDLVMLLSITPKKAQGTPTIPDILLAILKDKNKYEKFLEATENYLALSFPLALNFLLNQNKLFNPSLKVISPKYYFAESNININKIIKDYKTYLIMVSLYERLFKEKYIPKRKEQIDLFSVFGNMKEEKEIRQSP